MLSWVAMAKREYVHLSLTERDLITTMLTEEKSLGEIAKALGRGKSAGVRVFISCRRRRSRGCAS